jgi:hypothetical protein
MLGNMRLTKDRQCHGPMVQLANEEESRHI